jgi:hypothetical protein
MWLALCALVIGAPRARSQDASTVVLGDRSYRDLDQLIDAGTVTHFVRGQRPYSRRMFARLAVEARDELAHADSLGLPRSRPVRTAVARLLATFAEDIASGADASAANRYRVRSASLGMLTTDAPVRAVPDNGVGSMEADLNSLTDYQHGRAFATGLNGFLETDQAVLLPFGVSVQVQPRLLAYRARDARSGGATGELLTAHVRAIRGNVALTIGRAGTEWSPAPDAGLLFSANGPALNMVRLATDAPIVLPSVLRHLGMIAGTLQLADLGRSDSNSHSRLLSYKMSMKPTEVLELGAAFDNHFGGAGARGTGWLDRLIDFIPPVDLFRHHPDSTLVDSDKLLSADARLRIRRLANVTVFTEVAIEDLDFHRMRSILTEDAAYTAGLIVPVVWVPSVSARLAYHRVGIRFYEHHIFRDGITSRRFILGDDLGRDAEGVWGSLQAQLAPTFTTTLDVAADTRRNDSYVGSYTEPGLQGFVFTRLTESPRESRVRATFGGQWLQPGNAHMQFDAHLGAEQIRNFAFIARPSELHAVASLSATWFP